MLHHVSFSVRDPGRAAAMISQLVGARSVRAPCPPFPAGSWFVVMGDSVGSLIELTPWGAVLEPQKGIGVDPQMRPHTGSHVLAGTNLSSEEVVQAAERNGLNAKIVNAGLFQFVKVWIEGSLLLELLPPEHLPSYVECFGELGVSCLNKRLRDLEEEISS